MIVELEAAAFRAWPAAEVIDLDGWMVRYTSGVTRRANSVWPNAWTGGASLSERFERVEAFYAERQQPTYYQLSPAARPANLDAALAGRGYAVDAPVSIQTISVGTLCKVHAPAAPVRVAAHPDGDWLRLSADLGRFARVKDIYRALLDRIGDRAGFALAESDAGPAAVGLGVVDGAWLGIFSMLTLPEKRSAGFGRVILRALAQWSARAGARQAYLQVERDNTSALALYRAVGFQERYGYHYRVKRS